MSVSYSVFIKCKKPVNVIVSELEAILGGPLERTFNRLEYHGAVFLGLGISLVNPVTYLDDDLIKFSEYDYEIMVEYKGLFDKKYSDEFRRITSLILADMISQNLHCECFAAENVDQILATFEPGL